MRTIIIEVHNGIIISSRCRQCVLSRLYYKMGTVGTIASAVDNINFGIRYRSIKCTSKSGAIVVGNKSGISNVYIISTISAVPLKSVVRIVLYLKNRAINNVQYIVIAEINSMRTICCALRVHSHIYVIEGHGCASARANGHPAPLTCIRCRTDAVHFDIAVFESEAFSPQGNTIFDEFNRVFFGSFGNRSASYCQIFSKFQPVSSHI